MKKIRQFKEWMDDSQSVLVYMFLEPFLRGLIALIFGAIVIVFIGGTLALIAYGCSFLPHSVWVVVAWIIAVLIGIAIITFIGMCS